MEGEKGQKVEKGQKLSKGEKASKYCVRCCGKNLFLPSISLRMWEKTPIDLVL